MICYLRKTDVNDNPRQVYGPVVTVWTLPGKYLAKCPGEEKLINLSIFRRSVVCHKIVEDFECRRIFEAVDHAGSQVKPPRFASSKRSINQVKKSSHAYQVTNLLLENRGTQIVEDFVKADELCTRREYA
nr:PREDICTED: uncharacterized protein LOC108219617 isoform X2 [Daucus carota subsp. sativus]